MKKHLLKEKKGNCRKTTRGRFIQVIDFYENASGKIIPDPSEKKKEKLTRKTRYITHIRGNF
jgi:hypothetical protein